MDILDESTVVAYSSDDLQMALESDRFIYIYLGADIIMERGMTVNAGKASLIIDGLYPDVGLEIRSLSDHGGDAGTIIISSALEITFQNLNIAGRNYYGVPRVADGSAGEKTTVTYQNVSYVGPQVTFHRYGRTRYFNCTITIERTPGHSDAHEVAESRWIEIGGKTTIKHGSPSNAVFWFYNAGSSLTILKNAQVEIESVHDFLYRSNDYPKIIIQPNASLSLTTRYGIPRDTSHRVASILVDEGATFRYVRTTTLGTAAALYIDGAFTVNKGASVYMEANFSNDQRLLYFTANSQERGLYLNNPRSVVFYNSGTQSSSSDFRFVAETGCPFTTGQLNLWTTATPMEQGAGSFSDVAPGRWHKRDWKMFQITSKAETSATTVESCSLEESEINPNCPLTMVRLDTARVFSAGDLPLKVNPVVSEYRQVSGVTDPEGKVLIEYAIDDVVREIYTQADETGVFTAATENQEEIPAGTPVTVTANIPFLLVTATEVARQDGTLEIVQSPDLIRFLIKPLENTPGLLPREDSDAPVIISDSRVTLTPWELFAKIEGPLQTAQGDVLENGVVFSHEDGETGDFIVLNEDFRLVHQGTSSLIDDSEGSELIGKRITWAANRGILGKINNPMRLRKEYTTILAWEVRPSADDVTDEAEE